MILFLEDWADYPTAIIDVKTSNKSFIHVCNVYREMGVKNWMFPLALLQPELQGVDPFSPDLTEEQKVMIAMEVFHNPWYYFREIARVPAQAGAEPNQFRANRGNIALYWAFFNHIDFALIQPRQTGKSVSTDCLMNYLYLFILFNSRINMLTKDNGLRVANVERLKLIRDLTPAYLLNLSKQDADNQNALTYIQRGNKYSTSVAQSSEAAALNVGRGLTSPINHVDEGPFIKFIGTIIPALLASSTAAREEAKKNGQPYGNIFTTTAGKKDDRDGKYMYDMIWGGSPWTEKFFDARNEAELVKRITKNCTGNKIIINGTFSHRQLGKSDDWLREALINSGASGEEADRDFFNIWTSGTLRSPLSIKLNELIKSSERDPDWEEFVGDGYLWRWFIPESETAATMERDTFVLGMDTSDAIGRDDIGMVLVRSTDLKVAGAATINETNVMTFAHFVAEFLAKYENVTLIIECKSTGRAIIDALLLELPRMGIDPFKRIFNHVVEDMATREDDYRAINGDIHSRRPAFYNGYKRDFGFITTGQSRQLLYGNNFQEAAKRGGGSVNDRTLSNQIRSLVIKNGRIDHAASGHDDMVVAWLLAIWLLSSGKNLDHYGLDSSMCMALVSGNGRQLTLEDLAQIEEQKVLREEIRLVQSQLKGATDGFTIAKLESELRQLTSKTRQDGGAILNYDSLLKEVEEERQVVINKHRNSFGRTGRRTGGWGNGAMRRAA